MTKKLLASPTKRTVLLALTSAHHGFLRGVARYARENRWHLVSDMIYTAKIPTGWKGDGIISFIGYRDDLADFILSSGIPAVEISTVRDEISIPRVEGDNELIGKLAAEHFLERGFRNCAWAPMLDDTPNEERFRSFAGRLSREGIPCHILPPADTRHGTQGLSDWQLRRQMMITELKRLPKPLAVFGYNDCVAAGIIDACDDAGLLVPESVAVLGVDNDTMICESIPVPLSSVCHDLEGMAYQAAALLDQIMSGRKPPKTVARVPPKGLVTRRSSDMLAVDNLQVARALRFIRDHFTDPSIGVDQVVTATVLSRRALERAFRKEIKRSINEEIVRLRMEMMREMLVFTDSKVSEVSKACGFARVNHLFRSFRKSTGISPRSYRNMASSDREVPVLLEKPLSGRIRVSR